MLKSIRHRFKPQEISRELGALAGKDMKELTSDDILAIRRVYKRFRVLVLGPANAGKTTLLERLSDSPAGAATVTRDGKRVICKILRHNRNISLIQRLSLRSQRLPKDIVK
jgi:hypothetical protein